MNVSKEEFMQQMESMKQRSQQQSTYNNDKKFVRYFGLKDDGDEAVVRFAYGSADELYQDVVTLHNVTIDGKFKKVNCLRKFKDPIHLCPICESGKLSSGRLFIRLVEYTRDESGNIVAEPKVWDRPSYTYIPQLRSYFEEYGDLSNFVFKIKRSGAHGDKNTTYNIIPANPAIYNDQLYPKDFTAFTDYKILGGPVMEKDYNEMAELVDLDLDNNSRQQVFTPQSQQVAPAQPAYVPFTPTYTNYINSEAPTKTRVDHIYVDRNSTAAPDAQAPKRVIYQ